MPTPRNNNELADSDDPDVIREALKNHPDDVEVANRYWRALGRYKGRDVRSGKYVIEAYRSAALCRYQGVAALADAYRELYELSGESPRPEYFDKELITAVRDCESHLTGQQYSNVKWLIEMLCTPR